MAYTLPTAIGPWISGLIMDNLNPHYVWYICEIISVIAIIGFFGLYLRVKASDNSY